MKFVTQKVSSRRKLKTEDLEKTNILIVEPKLTFEALFKSRIIYKYILESSAVIPAQFPYIKI